MISVDNKTLCEFCFSEVDRRTGRCLHCEPKSNLIRYPTSLKEGTVLAGRYIVGRVLGKGGFGITYVCFDMKSKMRFAIKEYFPDNLAHRNSGMNVVTVANNEKGKLFKDGARKFYAEAKTVAKFNGHPGIIHVQEFFFENNTAYFAMEYLDGIDLKKYIVQNGGRINETLAIAIISSVADALAFIHSKNVLHRDISPDNIFICSDGSIRLIDFGAARQVVGEASSGLSVILKQGFAPFEQYQRKGNQGPWTDIYALGATLYYAVTGRVVPDAMSRLDKSDLPAEGLSPRMVNLLGKMLEVKIQNRFQSIRELKAALGTFNTSGMAQQPHNTAKKSFCVDCGRPISGGGQLCYTCAKRRESLVPGSGGKSHSSGNYSGQGNSSTGQGSFIDWCISFYMNNKELTYLILGIAGFFLILIIALVAANA